MQNTPYCLQLWGQLMFGCTEGCGHIFHSDSMKAHLWTKGLYCLRFYKMKGAKREKAFYVPDTVLGTLFMSFHLLLLSELWGRHYCLHLIEEKLVRGREVKGLTQGLIVRGWVEIQLHRKHFVFLNASTYYSLKKYLRINVNKKVQDCTLKITNRHWKKLKI